MRALLMGILVASCVAMSAWADGADDVNAGYEAFARGDPTLAVELYTRGIESGELTKEGLAIAYSNRCAAIYSLGLFESAVLDCDTAIELDPDDHFAYNVRGNARAAEFEHEEAILDFEKAIELDPDFADAYNSRGIVLRETGEFDKAIKDFSLAIWLRPDFAQAYLNRGETYRQERNFDRAMADYTTAIGLQPDMAGPYIGRGAVHQARGNKERAVADYRKAQSISPDHPYLKQKLREIGAVN